MVLGREGENFPATRLLHRFDTRGRRRHGDIFFDSRETGMLGQFRHRYFLRS
jgi:hypothetical protein